MHGSLKVVQGIVLLSFVGLMFSSCGGSQTTLSSNTTSGTTTVDPTPTSSGGESIEEEEKNATIPSGYSASNLFVTVPDSMSFLNFSSVEGSWADRCTFLSPSPNDLTCVVDVGELDLFYNGIKLQFNSPANQCKYIRTTPYWYYNYEIGFGPSEVTVAVTKDASGVVTSSSCTVDGVNYSCTTSAPPTVANDIKVDFTGDEINVRCNYDTSNVIGGANCCFGKYDLHTSLLKAGDEPINVDKYGEDWSGGSVNCIGGQGRTDWEDFDAEGLPIPLIERNKANESRTKIIKTKGPLFSIGMSSNIPVANYFTAGLHTHAGYGVASGTVSDAPYYVDPISDRSGSYIRPGNEYYTFECLDEAFETNYRIRMLVQDWNTVAALQTYVSTGSLAPGPDESGTAPGSCPGLAGVSCNQAQDADDFVNALGGYSNAVPSNRAKFFPKHSYTQ